MSQDCDVLVPAIAARAAGLPLEDDERRRCEEHLARCPSCPSLSSDVEKALAAAALEPRFASDGSWERIAEGIRVERARALAAPSLKILLSCTFCHGALDRREAAYCATCLAPHHAECFETHGRCGAPGCDETHTVTPRASAPPPRRRLRRLGWVALALVPAAAVAALSSGKLASKAPTSDGVSAVLSGGRTVLLRDAPEPPPYPEEWRPVAPGSPRDTLEKTRVTVHFAGTPLDDAFEELRDATGLPFVITGSARETIDSEQLKVSLEGKDVRAWEVLASILEVSDYISVVCNDHAVRIDRGDAPAFADPRALLDAEAWKRDYRAKLQGQSFSGRFQSTPLPEVVAAFRDATGLPFGVSRAIDVDEIKVTFAWPGGSAETALTEVLWSVGCDWELRNGMVWIAPRDRVHVFEHGGQSSFSAQAVTVPELVLSLREKFEGYIDVLATKEAWSSRGTVSFVWEPRDDAHSRGSELMTALASQTGLRLSVFHAAVSPRPHEVLVLDGEVPGTGEALSAVPAAYPAVAREVAELQRRLAAEVEARTAVRLADVNVDVPADAREVMASEGAVVRTAARILGLARRSKEIAGAKERLDSARKELDLLRGTVAQGEAEVSRLTAELREREAGIAKLDAVSCRARREQLLEGSRRRKLLDPERVELEELLLAERALAGSTSRAVAAQREARIALNQARTASFERAARIARFEDEVRAAEADRGAAAKLERGEALDESR